GLEPVEALIGLWSSVSYPGVECENADGRQPVTRGDLIIVEIMRGSDFDAPSAELRVDILVCDDGDGAPGQRQNDALTDQCAIALIARIDCYRDVAEHRLGARGCNSNATGVLGQRITDLP